MTSFFFITVKTAAASADPNFFIRFRPQPGVSPGPTPLNHPDGMLEWTQFRGERGGGSKARTNPLTAYSEWAEKLPRLQCIEAYTALGLVLGGGVGGLIGVPVEQETPGAAKGIGFVGALVGTGIGLYYGYLYCPGG